MIKPIILLQEMFKEAEELIAIIAKSISTAQKNNGSDKLSLSIEN